MNIQTLQCQLNLVMNIKMFCRPLLYQMNCSKKIKPTLNLENFLMQRTDNLSSFTHCDILKLLEAIYNDHNFYYLHDVNGDNLKTYLEYCVDTILEWNKDDFTTEDTCPITMTPILIPLLNNSLLNESPSNKREDTKFNPPEYYCTDLMSLVYFNINKQKRYKKENKEFIFKDWYWYDNNLLSYQSLSIGLIPDEQDELKDYLAPNSKGINSYSGT